MTELQVLVEKELADEKFSGRVHGRPSVYRDGCRGPLCLRAIRLRQRRQRGGGSGSLAVIDAMLEPFQQAHEAGMSCCVVQKGA